MSPYELKADMKLLKSLFKLLTIAGTILLLSAMFVVTYLVQRGTLAQNQNIRIR